MKVRYTATAGEEIEEILDYISRQNKRAAAQVSERLDQTIAVLADFSNVGQMTDEAGVRRIPVGRYPLLVFYTVEGNELIILHVRQTARRPLL